MMTNFLLIVAAIAVVGVVFEIVKESIQARKKSSDNGDNPTEGTSTEESKTESVFKTIQYTSTPTPTPEFKENSKSTTADYLSYAGTTVNNEVKVVDEKKEVETPKKKKAYNPRKQKDGKKAGKKEFKKKAKKGGEDNLLLS
jgi:FtsZ-interacting cell division protein ZipA